MIPSAVIDVGLANGTLLYMLAVLSAVYGIKVKVPELHEGKSNHIKHLYFLWQKLLRWELEILLEDFVIGNVDEWTNFFF